MKNIIALFLCFIANSLNAHELSDNCPSGLYTYKAEVTGVYDGDTITVDIDLGFHTWRRDEKLRLWGINAPELRGKNKKAGYASRDWLRGQILNQKVIIQTVATKHGKDKRGKYGRYLAIVFKQVDDECINLNQELIKKGYAVEHDY